MSNQTKYLHMENKFASHKQYLFGLLSTRNAKQTDTDQSILQAFLLCLKRNVSQTFQSSTCKKVLPKCVYHSTTSIDEYFPFHVVTGNIIFHTNLLLHRGLVQPSRYCVLWNKCFEGSPQFISIISTITLQLQGSK